MAAAAPREVDLILAQFPGPVWLLPRPMKWLGTTICALAMCALSVYAARQYPAWSTGAVACWITAAATIAGAVVSLFNMRPGVAYLRLDAKGFEMKMFRRSFLSWHVASEFCVERMKLNRYVAYRLRADAVEPQILRDVLPHRGRLSDNYGLP